MISYNGWIIHSNYYNYYNKNIKPYIDIEECKKIISLHDKKEDIYISQKKLVNIFYLKYYH